MRLGVCTSCLRGVSLPEVLRWAGQSGFQSVEIESPPVRGASTWYEDAALNVGGIDGRARDAFVTALEEAGLSAAALAWYADPLDRDAGRQSTVLAHLGRLVETAATLGIGVVCLAVGRDPTLPLGDCIAEFARRIAPIVEQAEAAGVKLAVDNSPWVGRQFEDMPGNAAFCPELWEKLFTHVRSRALGLAFNPAPLAWMGIDPLLALTDYAEKVFHVRAKDVETMDLRRQDCGVLRPSGGWWRYRLPGLGAIDWRRMMDRLHELGYQGAVVIEHDDPVWQGDLDRVKSGLGLAKRHLGQFMP